IRLLGPVEVFGADGEPIAVRGVRLQSLLVALALECGQAVSADRLADAVWPDAAPRDPANALQRHVSNLRQLLGPGSVERRGNGYALCLDAAAVDVHRFEALERRGRTALADGDTRHARALFDDALQLWRADALSSLTDLAFVQPDVTRLT